MVYSFDTNAVTYAFPIFLKSYPLLFSPKKV